MARADRLIKKYPNRRLYDTRTSAYVTLADIEALVVKREDFVVTDARSGEDLTRATLLQIVLDEQMGTLTRFPSDLLAQMIRSHSRVVRSHPNDESAASVRDEQGGRAEEGDPALSGYPFVHSGSVGARARGRSSK
ncbi:polyhydroxyalkanoate synthesis regulator DNA-binding domain-containing protein [Niveibacterium terrae]|uniref:polyhydroxyalkanoate synthesis regulator DNA-binding domain-containing protein n=1 Tax=Niveibacterium terrae TaxID=3373598 RepID=UPI003A8ED606